MNVLRQLLKLMPGTLISVIIMLFIRIRLFKRTGKRILLFGLETAKNRDLKTIILEFMIQFIAVIISRIFILRLKT